MGRSNIEQISIGECALEEYDLKYIPKNALCVIHNYEAASYEGSGWALIRYHEGWDAHDMGHCSCYGPLDHYEKANKIFPLDDIAQNMSKAALSEIKPVLAAAIKWEESYNGTK